MNDFEFIPKDDDFHKSNVYRFMQKHKISSLNELCLNAKNNLDWYWNAVNEDIGIFWHQKFTKISDLSSGKPWAKWFTNGKTNIISSSIEKFSKKTPHNTAYFFVSEDGIQKKITYRELENQVNQLANGLKTLGVKKGDVLAIYMPMIEESIIAILACAKIGAVQTVIFSGYSSQSLQIRLQDCNAKILFVSDGFFRKGKQISQKTNVSKAVIDTNIQKIIVIPYKGIDNYDTSERIVYYDQLVSAQTTKCETQIMDSEDPLYILYTSGTTGKPKGVIHTHGGFSVFAGHQSAYLVDTQPEDVLFWPADIGWITGLVWNVYGLLELGSSAVIYDGAIDWPDKERIWKIIQQYNVTIFGISPTAVRILKTNNFVPVDKYNLESLRIMASTGEPIDEDSWRWLFEKVGNKKLPIMNLIGGTEIGGAMLSVLPGMKLKPTTVGIPCPGIDVDVFNNKGNSVQNEKGFLVVKQPWPAMTRGLLNDDERYLEIYWSQFDDVWSHGDYVMVDEDGLWYMLGRTDDVMNISGHRLSTTEIEQTVISHEKILDVASVSIPDDITGESIVLFVVLKDQTHSKDIENELREFISEKIGKIARPKKIFSMTDLPKTRTGKIMRRLLRAKLLGLSLGDISSLENPQVIDEISKI